MIGCITLGTNDLERAAAFYGAVLAGLADACSGHGSVADCPIIEAAIHSLPHPLWNPRKRE